MDVTRKIPNYIKIVVCFITIITILFSFVVNSYAFTITATLCTVAGGLLVAALLAATGLNQSSVTPPSNSLYNNTYNDLFTISNPTIYKLDEFQNDYFIPKSTVEQFVDYFDTKGISEDTYIYDFFPDGAEVGRLESEYIYPFSFSQLLNDFNFVNTNSEYYYPISRLPRPDVYMFGIDLLSHYGLDIESFTLGYVSVKPPYVASRPLYQWTITYGLTESDIVRYDGSKWVSTNSSGVSLPSHILTVRVYEDGSDPYYSYSVNTGSSNTFYLPNSFYNTAPTVTNFMPTTDFITLSPLRDWYGDPVYIDGVECLPLHIPDTISDTISQPVDVARASDLDLSDYIVDTPAVTDASDTSSTATTTTRNLPPIPPVGDGGLFGDIWGYVVSWLDSISDGLSLILQAFGALPLSIQIMTYAAVAVTVVVGVMRLLL